MLNELQQDIFTEITQDCTINLSGVEQLTVEQTPDHLKSPVRLHDTSWASMVLTSSSYATRTSNTSFRSSSILATAGAACGRISPRALARASSRNCSAVAMCSFLVIEPGVLNVLVSLRKSSLRSILIS